MVGFNARNKETLNLQYLCRICLLILRDPVQLICGHRQCKSCTEAIDKPKLKCLECQEESSKDEVLLDKGFQKDMQTLVISCYLCSWSGLFKDYQHHLRQKHPNPVCEHCGKQFDSTNDLDLHKLNQCDKITVSCTLKDFGCSDSVVRVEMSKHYASEQHQNAIITLVRRFISKQSDHEQEKGYKMDIDFPNHSTTTMIPSYDQNANIKLEEICETINLLVGGLQVLTEEVQRLSDESLGLNNGIDVLSRNFSTMQISIQEEKSYLDGIKPNQEILNQDVASLMEKMEDLQYVSYDGTLIWKISSFKEKLNDAQSERQTSIYSPPFYSSPTGYKMRARLYLHGDGNARRTHMSLFFVLMRSEHDAILKFPFNYKVTFCMYDQTPQQRHIIDSFRPDIRSNSFQRPRSEMNIASGIPKFFPLAMIEQEGNPYVRDDTMFIKIMVDFSDMPKAVLPYALSLNPGLPMIVQQQLIKEEVERKIHQPPSTSS